MKVALVLPCNLYGAPFFRRYESILLKCKVEFELIFWNRKNINEESKCRKIEFNVPDEVLSGNKLKIFKYVKFIRFVKRTIRKEKYDKLIILGSYGGLIAFLSFFLKKHYKTKYWLDIRDYTFENNKIYFNLMKTAIESSAQTAISSEGFKKFLPDNNYTLVHNIDYENIAKTKLLDTKEASNNIIKISYIGLIGYFEENIKFINVFKNDERFRLQFYGANSEKIEEYCIQNNINNVDFFGRFNPEMTSFFYSKTDVINNIYGNSNINLRTALSNKLYFSAFLNLPIIVSKNTYMADIVTKYNLGYVIDFNKNDLKNDFYKWYIDFTTTQKNVSGSHFLEKSINDDKVFESKLKKFLDS